MYTFKTKLRIKPVANVSANFSAVKMVEFQERLKICKTFKY
jgi:hypothetical protein